MRQACQASGRDNSLTRLVSTGRTSCDGSARVPNLHNPVPNAGLGRVGLIASLVLVFAACDRETRNAVTSPPVPEASPAPASISEPALEDDSTIEAPVPAADEFVVYLGSFRDYRAAATYSEALRSAGLLDVDIRRAKAGGEMLVTSPMSESEASELAERLGGRVLSVESLARMTEDYGFLLPKEDDTRSR